MNPSDQIDKYIARQSGWREKRLTSLRNIINENGPELSEDWKWGCPVWNKKGPVCAISAFKNHVKINFFKGVLLKDVAGLFNSGLDSKLHRSINFRETDEMDQSAIGVLVQQAVAM